MNQGAPPDLDETFFISWVNACSRLRIDPVHLARVAYSESGMRPSAHNFNGNAVGLIQFMPSTLLGLGWTKGWDAFGQLTATEQVPFVERYYRVYAPECTSDALCYVATFLPALLHNAAAMGHDYVLCGKDGPLAWAYRANPGLDRDGDGRITVGDLSRQLETACKGARYAAIVDRIQRARGEDPPPIPEPEPTLPDLPFIPGNPYDHTDEDDE